FAQRPALPVPPAARPARPHLYMLPSAPADTSAARRSKIQARTRKNAARATSGSLGGGGGADMGRIPCCDKDNVKRGLWTPKEDDKLLSYITQYGTRNWRLIPKNAGESARGAPCRLGERNVRWLLSLALNEVALHCLPRVTGLQRCSKSCRVRWTNYMLPDLKHGEFTDAEEQTIIKLHPALGNRYPTMIHAVSFHVGASQLHLSVFCRSVRWHAGGR
uniref:Uncharacterized protein n=1 Tax=Aegilops tauschii subsp. strangulata TaxID=200361 RepID=A0A453D7A7_AEGTS